MPSIDFMTALPRDVIARSIAMHPSLLAEGLEAASRTHADASRSTLNTQAREIANRLRAACFGAAILVRDDDVETIMADMDKWTSALIIACRLQCLPHANMLDIASRHGGAR